MSEPVRHKVVVIADDLIWASRLNAAVRAAGADAARPSDADANAAVIDLNGRTYDGVAAVAEAAAAGRLVAAVGQHEDIETRRRALAAGASEVYSYNRFFREGPKLVARLIEALQHEPIR